MKAKELRIGNLIFKPKYENGQRILVPRVVTAIGQIGGKVSKLEDGNYIFNYSDVEPIPLTEEWLVKFGFVDDSLPERYSTMGPVNCFKCDRLSVSSQDGKYYPVRKYDNIQHVAYGVGLEYVHQLQNLYFALTGEELTIR
jgi:hypothetical protein